ncbi:hypothetical protein GCM10010946_34510 [Undibacterium squillarum]|uniref:Uncharacterized protein n=1 Tax=Undibacterium squillarum TaxID=1131567 RepID=A0ABQ2Y341_9BURK|nr:hypothetical protein GCM10010946_34510 [Undibacterium squillarum]
MKSGAAADRDFTGIFEEPQGLVMDGMVQMSDPSVEFRNEEITLRKDDKIQNLKTGKIYAVTRIRHAEDGSYSVATLGSA